MEAASEVAGGKCDIIRIGVPDRFLEHGSRDIILRELGLDARGIANRIKGVFHGLKSRKRRVLR